MGLDRAFLLFQILLLQMLIQEKTNSDVCYFKSISRMFDPIPAVFKVLGVIVAQDNSFSWRSTWFLPEWKHLAVKLTIFEEAFFPTNYFHYTLIDSLD